MITNIVINSENEKKCVFLQNEPFIYLSYEEDIINHSMQKRGGLITIALSRVV